MKRHEKLFRADSRGFVENLSLLFYYLIELSNKGSTPAYRASSSASKEISPAYVPSKPSSTGSIQTYNAPSTASDAISEPSKPPH
ncbi:MAG: hypothetical protein AUG51_03140 [Acidobacteria bacterium 13_1_20CM_3_53_8]|nr:MAG: hypothetical protein AUG51_03140 [Acidobacteria bacterium 13_1_20CM_3_53_8]